MDKNQLKHIIKEEYQNVKSFMEDKYGFTPELGKVISNPYAKSFVNEVSEPEVISQLRDIVNKKQNKKIKDPKSGKMMRVDMFSASAIVKVYDAVNKSNKEKFSKLSLPKMVNVAFTVMKKESVNEGYGDWVKAKNLTDIIKLSKQKKNATFYVTDDNNSRIGSFYLKNGKFAKATTANPNYDLQRNKTKLKDRSDVIYKYKVDESVNEAKFYVTRNLGRGQGKSLVGGWDFKKDKKLPPKEFRTYKDAEKYIEKMSRGGSKPGNPTAYFVTDKDMNMVDKKGKRKKMFEGMFSTIDQIKQDSKDVRDFVKNVFKDRDFVKMKNDKEFIKYLKSIYESKGVPQNYMQGRTSDYHTALRGKNRDYSGGTNFKKNNHGQPDIEKDDEDQETNQLSVQQTKLKEEMGKLSSSERIELYKLYSKAMKAMPGSPNQKKLKVIINKLRKKADLKPLPINEAKLDHHRISGNSIELLVRHNRQKYAIKFKDKRILDKMGFDWSKPKNIEKLLSLKKFPKGMSVSRSFHEYGQRLDLSYLEDEEARLKGTPKPKDAIDRDIDENVKVGQMIKYDDRFLGKGTAKVKHIIQAKPNKAGVTHHYITNKGTFSNQSLIGSDDYKKRYNEYSGGSYEYTKGDQYGQNSIDEAGVFPVTNYIKGIIPPGRLNTNTPENRKNSEKLVKDLRNTLNKFWKQHDIPFKIR